MSTVEIDHSPERNRVMRANDCSMDHSTFHFAASKDATERQAFSFPFPEKEHHRREIVHTFLAFGGCGRVGVSCGTGVGAARYPDGSGGGWAVRPGKVGVDRGPEVGSEMGTARWTYVALFCSVQGMLIQRGRIPNTVRRDDGRTFRWPNNRHHP